MSARRWLASPRTRWRAGFLAVTALAIVMECVAAFDSRPDTEPWTDLIVAYVPAEVFGLLLGAAVFWLPIHFGIRYWKRHHAKS